MKIQMNLSREAINEEIEGKKEFAIPLIVILSSVLLFIIFILPTLLSFSTKKGERDIEVAKLNQIRAAKEVLATANPETLDSELELASLALPAEKNFEIVLNAISTAASQSISQIDSYQFTDNRVNDLNAENSIPSVAFTIDVIGDESQAAQFIAELYKTYPISDVKGVSYNEGVSTISVVFYYKPFTAVQAADAALAREKSSEESKAMNEISKWSETNFIPSFIDQSEASNSAGARTSPF